MKKYILLKRLQPGAAKCMVFQLALNVPEILAMQENNRGGVLQMRKQRRNEPDILSSPALREFI